MKVAFLSFYSGRVNRGVETYVSELSRRLVRLGYEVKVFDNTTIRSSNIYEFTKDVLSKVDMNTDILVATNGRWQGFLCKLWCIKNRKKLVIPGQSGPGIDDRFNLWMFPNVFIGLTEYQSGWAKNINPFVRTVEIPNGVDSERFRKTGNSFKSNLPKPIILCVSALVSIKRLDLAIKAVSYLEKGSLVLVGKGEKGRELEDLGRKLLPGRFKIMSVSYDQMPQVYREANLFTFPTSEWESFGIAILEAMASGLPVVASDDPIRREIVGNAGLFVNPENTQEYANALEKALTIKWGNKPREQAEKFSWDKIAQQYDELFKSLI